MSDKTLAAIDELRRRASGLDGKAKSQLAAEVAQKYGMSYDELLDTNSYLRKHGELPGETFGAGPIGAVRELAGGFAFEAADELEAGVRSIFDERDFDEILNEIAQERAAFQRNNPALALGLNVGGALGTGGLAVLKLPMLAARPLAAGVPASTLAGATTGAMTGTTFAERKANTLQGGIFGAAGGVVGYGAGKGINAARNKMRGVSGADINAASRFADDGMSADDVIAQINRNEAADKAAGLQGQEVLADYGGDSVRRGLRGARTVSGEASNKVRNTLEPRQRGSEVVLNGDQEVLMQSQRVARDLENAKGVAFVDTIPVVKQLHERQYSSPQIGKHYNAAYKDFANITDKGILQEILDQPRLREAYQTVRENELLRAGSKAERMVVRTRYPKDFADFVKVNDAGDVIGLADGYGEGISIQYLDLMKRFEGNRIFGNEQPLHLGGKNIDDDAGRVMLANFKERLVGVTGGESGDYAQALKKSSEQFELADALKVGDKIMKMPIDKAKAKFAELTEGQKDVIRVAYLDDMVEAVKKKGSGQNATTVIDDTAKRREQLQLIFDGKQEAFTNFMERLKREREMFITRQRVATGSETADKSADVMANANRFMDLFSGNVLSQARVLGEAAGDMQTPGNAAKLADMMLETNPAKQRAQMERLKRLEETMNAQRAITGGAVIGGGLIGGQSVR